MGAWLPSIDVIEALKDDLNTPLAIAELHERAKDAKGGSLCGRRSSGLPPQRSLGFDVRRLAAVATMSAEFSRTPEPDAGAALLTAARRRTRHGTQGQELQGGDRIRDELAAMGYPQAQGCEGPGRDWARSLDGRGEPVTGSAVAMGAFAMKDWRVRHAGQRPLAVATWP